MKREEVSAGLSLDPRPTKRARMENSLGSGFLTSFQNLWSTKSHTQKTAPSSLTSDTRDPSSPGLSGPSQSATPVPSTASTSRQTTAQPSSSTSRVLSPSLSNASTSYAPSVSSSTPRHSSGGIFASNRHSNIKHKTDQRLNKLREEDKQIRSRLQSSMGRFSSKANSMQPSTAEMAAYQNLVLQSHKAVSDFLRSNKRVAGPTSNIKARSHFRPEALERVLNNASLSRRAQPPIDLDSKSLQKLQREREREAARAKSVLTRRRIFPPALPDKINSQVAGFLSSNNFLSEITGASVATKDLRRLKPNCWLNDEIITFYITLINRRSNETQKLREQGQLPKYKPGQEPLNVFAFNSFFLNKYQREGYKNIKRWTKKTDVFTKDAILIPINLNNTHWVCAVINIRQKRFEFYDSMGSWNQDIVDALRQWLVEEHKEKKGSDLEISDWIDYQDPDTPQQHNAVDCGMFICATLEACSRKDGPLDFSQANMPYLRQKMVWEIHSKQLMDEEWS